MTLKELLAKLQELKNEARALLAAGKVDETEVKVVEIRSLEKEADRLQALEPRVIPAVVIPGSNQATEERAAFNHYLRTGELRAMAVSDATKGAALAPVSFAKEIVEGLKDVVVMRQLARNLPPISGKSAAYPRRTGGTGAAMVSEGAPITPYDLTFNQLTLTPKKAGALIEVSNELLQDEAVDLAGYLSQHFIDEIGDLLETQYWLGDGAAPNLSGILLPANGITRVDTALATTVSADDILNLWAALPAKYRKTASFVCNSAMEAVLRLLKDAEGRYLLVADLATGLGNTLLGRPLIMAENFPGTLAAGTDALMLGDFSRGVFIADKAGIDVQRNDAIGFNKDTVSFRAIFRTDVVVAWTDALRILKVKAA